MASLQAVTPYHSTPGDTLGSDGFISSGGGSEISYTALTSGVTISATSSATANTILTAPAHTYDGVTRTRIEAFFPYVSLAAAGSGNTLTFWLYQDGTLLGGLGQMNQGAAGISMVMPLFMVCEITPALGSRTYSVRAHRSNADCNVQGGSGGFQDGYLRIT